MLPHSQAHNLLDDRFQYSLQKQNGLKLRNEGWAKEKIKTKVNENSGSMKAGELESLSSIENEESSSSEKWNKKKDFNFVTQRNDPEFGRLQTRNNPYQQFSQNVKDSLSHRNYNDKNEREPNQVGSKLKKRIKSKPVLNIDPEFYEASQPHIITPQNGKPPHSTHSTNPHHRNKVHRTITSPDAEINNPYINSSERQIERNKRSIINCDKLPQHNLQAIDHDPEISNSGEGSPEKSRSGKHLVKNKRIVIDDVKKEKIEFSNSDIENSLFNELEESNDNDSAIYELANLLNDEEPSPKKTKKKKQEASHNKVAENGMEIIKKKNKLMIRTKEDKSKIDHKVYSQKAKLLIQKHDFLEKESPKNPDVGKLSPQKKYLKNPMSPSSGLTPIVFPRTPDNGKVKNSESIPNLLLFKGFQLNNNGNTSGGDSSQNQISYTKTPHLLLSERKLNEICENSNHLKRKSPLNPIQKIPESTDPISKDFIKNFEASQSKILQKSKNPRSKRSVKEVSAFPKESRLPKSTKTETEKISLEEGSDEEKVENAKTKKHHPSIGVGNNIINLNDFINAANQGSNPVPNIMINYHTYITNIHTHNHNSNQGASNSYRNRTQTEKEENKKIFQKSMQTAQKQTYERTNHPPKNDSQKKKRNTEQDSQKQGSLSVRKDSQNSSGLEKLQEKRFHIVSPRMAGSNQKETHDKIRIKCGAGTSSNVNLNSTDSSNSPSINPKAIKKIMKFYQSKEPEAKVDNTERTRQFSVTSPSNSSKQIFIIRDKKESEETAGPEKKL